MTTTPQIAAEVKHHRTVGKAHFVLADDLEKGSSLNAAPAPKTTTKAGMTQHMTWLTKHGSVLKAITAAGGSVTTAEFLKIARPPATRVGPTASSSATWSPSTRRPTP